MEEHQFGLHGDPLALEGPAFFHHGDGSSSLLPPLPSEEPLLGVGDGSFLPGNDYCQQWVVESVHPAAALAHLSADASAATLPPLQGAAASWAGGLPGDLNPWGFGGHQRVHGDDGFPMPLDGVLLLGQQAQVGAGADPPPPARANQVDDDDDLAVVETIQVAQMASVAAQCGQKEGARTVWSQEEHKELLRGLDRYAKEERAMRCLLIARHLPNKTASDVALRCRWLQNKKRSAEEAELVDKNPAAEKVNKKKKSKGVKINKKTYPLSKEAIDSKLTKELIQDNHMFLERIKESFKTGQLDNTADYFYYVITNLDAIEKRLSKSGINMTIPLIDGEGL